jgi:hypothetical protein
VAGQGQVDWLGGGGIQQPQPTEKDFDTARRCMSTNIGTDPRCDPAQGVGEDPGHG